MDRPQARIRDFLVARDIDATDRRADRRYSCSLEATIRSAAGLLGCQIVSLSQGGLSAEAAGEFAKGEVLEVAPAPEVSGDSRPLKFVVRWTSSASPDKTVHLALVEPAPEGSWMVSQLEELKARAKEAEQRREGIRVVCRIPAETTGNGERQPATVIDLGTTGARLELVGEPGLQELLQLRLGPLGELPAVTVQAEVVSASGGQVGVVFTGVESAQAKEILRYMREAFSARRS